MRSVLISNSVELNVVPKSDFIKASQYYVAFKPLYHRWDSNPQPPA